MRARSGQGSARIGVPQKISGTSIPQAASDNSSSLAELQEADSADREHGLVLRARLGDKAAFEALVAEHEAFVYRIAARMLHTDPEDAAQEAFIRAYNGLDGFRGESSFRTWLAQIVVNVCKKAQTRGSIRDRRYIAIDTVRPAVLDEHTADSSKNPERAHARQELRRLVKGCIDKLAEKYRLPIMLVDIEDMSYEEAAAAIGIRVSTLKVRLYRARRKLEPCLDGILGRDEEVPS